MLALVTCVASRGTDPDLPVLLEHLPDAEIEAWDDPGVEWNRYDRVVIRSTWNYHLDRQRFLGWCRSVAAVTDLWNPVPVVEWNTDKRYLRDLDGRGVPIVPTRFVEPGGDVGDPRLGLPDLDPSGDVVVKPSVGAGSMGAARFVGDAEGVAEHVRGLHANGVTAMVQPYLRDIDTLAETCLVYLGGEFSHAAAKQAILASEITLQADGLAAVETLEPRTPSAAERAIGDRVLAGLPPTAYLRVDIVPTADGPAVIEVEATEPSLFLDLFPDAAARAAAVFRSVGR